MKQLLSLLIPVVMLSACRGGGAKVLVITRGDIAVNGTSITITDDNSYAEKTIDLSGSGNNTLSVTAPTGTFRVDVPGPGFYLLNVRKDTLLGAWQKLGRDLNSDRIISQEDLKIKIDSLRQLMADSNVSASGRNFFITPGKLQKISDNLNADVIGPFQLIPATLDPGPDGKGPELYKFYTSGEMREMITKLNKLTQVQN